MYGFHSSSRPAVTPRRWLAWITLTALLAGLFIPASLWGSGRARAAPQAQLPLDVIISEVAWGGTAASPADEWIELYNPGSTPVSILGWQLVADDAGPTITLAGTIQPGGFFLLERTDDTTVSDLPADQIYASDQLLNSGETLRLIAPGSIEVDTVNLDGGAWPAGSASPSYYSMERQDLSPDVDLAWGSNDGAIRYGMDANSNPLNGTPKQYNSVWVGPTIPTATPTQTSTPTLTGTPTNTGTPTGSASPTRTRTPTRTPSRTPTGSATATATPSLLAMINEVAWAGTTASSDDEWIELYNPGASPLDLSGWRLVADDGSPDILLVGSIPPGGYFLLERAHDNVVANIPADQIFFGALDDHDEILRLRSPSGTIVDTANHDAGAWPAGSTNPVCSMERYQSTLDGPSGWATNCNPSVALDAAGGQIRGTPRGANWAYTVTPTITPTGTGLRSIVINEVAWAGTGSSSTLQADEWIELYNPGTIAVNLTGWRLTGSGGGYIDLVGIIPAEGFFLLERTDDSAVIDVDANQAYTSMTLSNSGEILRLFSSKNTLVDTANLDGGSWPAGTSASTYASMERRGTMADSAAAWITYASTTVYAHNAVGGAIKGTPGRANWANSVTPTPSKTRTPTRTLTRTPTRTPNVRVLIDLVYLNEIVPRAGRDWNSDGKVDVYDEYIEVVNQSDHEVELKGWVLEAGEGVYPLPSVKIKPNQHVAFFRLTTGIALSDAGETVRLTNNKGQIVDAYTYPVVRSPDLSWCRLPDATGQWSDKCLPTPFKVNTSDGSLPVVSDRAGFTLVCLVPDTAPPPILEAECDTPGGGVYNPALWGETLPGQDLWIDPEYEGPILLY